jgi:uncharacterized OsmC-like protein
MSNGTTTIDPLLRIVNSTERQIKDDPSKAAALFKADGSGTGRVSSTIRIGRFTVDADEPAALGDDAAPNPVEYALAGLLSCQVATYRVWAAKLGIELTDIDIAVEGDLDFRGFFGLDEQTRPGFSEVRLAVRLTGPATPERYAELQTGVNAHCPVADLFTRPTPVHTSLTVA